MTTVAWDGNILAADSLVTNNHQGGYMPSKDAERKTLRFDQVTKIRHFKEGNNSTIQGETIRAVGGAGKLSVLKTVFVACSSGMNIDKVLPLLGTVGRDLDARLLFITDKQIWIVVVEPCGSRNYQNYPFTEKVAIGSGQAAALLLMRRFGLSAPAAVAGASTVCDYTDRRVRYLVHPFTEQSQVYAYTDEDIEEIFEEIVKT